MKSVEVYAMPGCDACRRAVALIEGYSLPVHIIDASQPFRRIDLERRLPGVTLVPQIFVGNTHIGGLEELEQLPLAHLQQMVAE